MAKKKSTKRVKQRALVGILGKDLTRRSRGLCELCGSRTEVRPWELTPFPEEPSLERALMACKRCRHWLGRDRPGCGEYHFLLEAVWHEEHAIRLAAARLLSRCEQKPLWIDDALTDFDAEAREFAVQ